MTVTPQEVRQILSSPPYLKFIPFQKTIFLPETKPNDKVVERHFGHIMMDLELNTEEKIETLRIPKEKRWDFYCDHVKNDAEIPSPTYLINCIKIKSNPRLLESLAIQFSKNRISYRQQFLDSSGFELLIDYVRIFSENPNSEDNQILMPYVFDCLQNIANSAKFGPSYFEKYIDEFFPIFFDLMIKLPFSINFKHILSIISGLFSSTSQSPNYSIILKTIKLLQKQPQFFWEYLKNIVDQKEFKILNKFTRLLLCLNKNYNKERFDLVIMFSNNKFMDSIRELSNSLFSDSLEQYDSDIKIISQFSKKLCVNPFSYDSLLDEFKQNSKNESLFSSILLSLNNILTNYETDENNQITLNFIHNFLIFHRYHLANNIGSKIETAALSASSNLQPIKLPYNGSNSAYQQLNNESYYLNDSLLKTTNLSDFAKLCDNVPDSNQVLQLTNTIERLKTYIQKLKDAHYIANALDFEQKQIMDQINILQNENMHLKAQVVSLRNKLQKYEKADISDQTAIELLQTEFLKNKINSLESKVGALQKTNKNLVQKIEKDKITVAELLKSREAAFSESERDEISRIKTEHSDMLSKNSQLQGQIKEYESRINELGQENEDLRSKCASLESVTNNLNELLFSIQESQEKSVESQSATSEIGASGNNMEDSGTNESQQIDSLVNENKELRLIQEQLTRDIENMKKRLQISESENDALRHEEIVNVRSQAKLDNHGDEMNLNDITNKSLNENTFILNQLASQQQQIEILRSQLAEYEARDWNKINPSYDLHNANIDEIVALRKELNMAKEQLMMMKNNNAEGALSDKYIIMELKNELNVKKAEIDEIKDKFDSVQKELNNKNSQSNSASSSVDRRRNSIASSTPVGSPSKKFSFKNLLKK